MSEFAVPTDPASVETVAMYDRIPQTFAGHFAGFRSIIPDVELAHDLAHVPIGRSRVSEAGCGDGRDAQTAIVDRVESYTGYDPSKGLLEIARARFPGARDDMFQEGYAQTTDYGEDNDIIIAINSVLHVPKHDLPAMFERSAAGLRKGGVFYIVTKTEETDKTDPYHDNFDGVTGDRMFYHYTVKTLVETAAEAGLEPVYLEKTKVETKDWDWLNLGVAKAA